ncbi:MAG: pirin family protein [Flavobacteriia bacterium]|nr:pirin family protein [Flavobacteriia bacterium]
MEFILYPANERGHADHGWLKAKHSFSFANWYNPDKMHFGALRVLNDDIVAPKMGFGTHPHDNMEIITIPLKGKLEHKDSMGHSSVITTGEIQVMSAGTGILHSEFNASLTEEIHLFQIWIFPNKKNVTPRYDQININYAKAENNFLQLISPNETDEGSWINQDAWIFINKPSKGTEITYSIKKEGNGIYIMVIEGSATIERNKLLKRDAIGIYDTTEVCILAHENSEILIIEVPMVF